MLALVLAAVLACGEPSTVTPAKVWWTQSLPDDVIAEIAIVESRFGEWLGPRADCVAPVELVLLTDVQRGDARYLVHDGRIEIQIPTSPRRFRDSLVHELAHHLEHTCDDFEAARVGLLGVLDANAWDHAPTWEQTPSELSAEAIVGGVLGERVRYGRTMPIDPAVEDVLNDWRAG